MNSLPQVDKTWTLFLDRDGVINHEKKMDYIRNWSEFTFYDQVKEALKILNEIFGVIVMVTNQKGIGKGLMTVEDLTLIHDTMQSEVSASGGRIDKIYYCSALNNDCYERKPNPGMARLAKTDFPSIDFNRSLIVGNKLTDMQFGRNVGIYTVYVNTTDPEVPSPNALIDFRFNNLYEVAHQLKMAITKS